MGESLRIKGNNTLVGEVSVGGAKNSLVALIPASIITKSVIKLTNVKPIEDTYTLLKILEKLNVFTLYDNKDVLYIDARKVKNCILDCEEVMKMRASYYFMGALLSLYKKVGVIGPGGCNFGERPIDLHLKAFESLGVNYTLSNDLYLFNKNGFSEKSFRFEKKSVGATINAILASCKTKSKITFSNCAMEPEIDDLINFLNLCGCNIERQNESIIIRKCSKIHGCEYKVMSDRIEAGTFMIIGSLLSDNLKINNINPNYLSSLIKVLEEIGVTIEKRENSVIVKRGNIYKAVNVVVDTYPGFPTDLQQPLSVLLCKCDGVSTIKETIYPARLSHIDSLNAMGADIFIKDELIVINGNRDFVSNRVSGKDLRGGISLVIAALLANGESIVEGVKYIKRGYSDLVRKLKRIGASVELEEVSNEKENC